MTKEEIVSELQKINNDNDNTLLAENVQEVINHLNENNLMRAYKYAYHYLENHTLIQKIKKLADTELNEAVNRLGGEQEFVYEYIVYVDDDGGFTNHYRKSTTVSLSEMLNDLRDSRWYKDEWNSLENVKDVIERYTDIYEDSPCTFFGTEKEYNQKKQDERRKKLEEDAKGIAYRHGVKVDSIEFLKAVDKEIQEIESAKEEWNNPEVRMEEWAACRYAGVGSDVYFDDLNFENGRYDSCINNLQGIMEWVSENCPLLWAKYEESLLAEKEEDDDAD